MEGYLEYREHPGDFLAAVASNDLLRPPNLPTMISRSPRIDLYAPKTLAVMDQAFAAIWNVLKADDPFRDYAKDGELRIAVGPKAAEPGGRWSDRSASASPAHYREHSSRALASNRQPMVQLHRTYPTAAVREARLSNELAVGLLAKGGWVSRH